MKFRFVNVASAFVMTALLACAISAQTAAGVATETRMPSSPARPFVVMKARTLAEVERKLHPATNKGEELIGGEGMELRVVVQHENNLAATSAEIHDASDDVYYVLEGTATLTLGGRLEAPKEIEPGEWRGPRIERRADVRREERRPRHRPARHAAHAQHRRQRLLHASHQGLRQAPARAQTRARRRDASEALKTFSG